MNDLDLPELPEGYSWWIDKYDLAIVKNLPDTKWTRSYTYEPNNDIDTTYLNKPRFDTFYQREYRTTTVEYYNEFFMLFGIKVKNRRLERQRRDTHRKKIVISRGNEFRTKVDKHNELVVDPAALKAAGLNTRDNVGDRAAKLYKEFMDNREAEEISGHYPA